MEGVDVSPQFKATSLSVPSTTASHIACLAGARLQIRCLATFELVRNIPLPTSQDVRNPRLAWSPPTTLSYFSSTSTSRSSSTSTPPHRSSRPPLPRSNRILISDADTTRVYDLRDEKWNAVISNGSGGMGKNVHVEFGADEDEVLVWSDYTACVKIWCLKTGRAVEIRDPKFSGKEGKGWGHRPVDDTTRGRRGKGRDALALLCRPAGMDVLLVLAAKSYTVLARVELPTADAAGLKWSPDGRWLAIWDTASSGYKLLIYTADGHLYRTITQEISPDDEVPAWDIEGLGIKTLEWLPGNDRLAVGGWDRRVRILSTRTFAPVVFLDHTPSIHVPSAPVYTEHIDGQGNRRFELTPQPVTPPKAALEKNETSLMKQGVGIMAFNSEGSLVATRHDSSPCTIWIWDLRILRPRMVVVLHSNVRSLSWHPDDVEKLLVQSAADDAVVYIYTATSSSTSSSTSASTSTSTTSTPSPPPAILTLSPHITKPKPSSLPKWSISWLTTPPHKKPIFTLAHQQGYILVWPQGKDQILRFERADGEEDEEEEDSLFEILTGRKEVPRLDDGRFGGEGEDRDREMDGDGIGEEGLTLGSASGLDDTFREKRNGVRGGGGDGRGMSSREIGLDESGIDEMF